MDFGYASGKLTILGPRTMKGIEDIKSWVKKAYSDFVFDIVGFATSSGEVIPLNLEPGTLGNVIEGALIAHLKRKLGDRKDIIVAEGGNRRYPDLEITGPYFDNTLFALDIKAARRNPKSPHRTKSRITLYTFGTYLKHRNRGYPQILRPFDDYAHHLDLIAIFDVDETAGTVGNFELIVAEPWRIASKTPSSQTRDYVGAVMEIEKMRNENGGVFTTPQEFYDFWGAKLRRGEAEVEE